MTDPTVQEKRGDTFELNWIPELPGRRSLDGTSNVSKLSSYFDKNYDLRSEATFPFILICV